MTKEQIYELKHKRAEVVAAAKGLLAAKNMEGYAAKMAEVDSFNGEIDASEKLLAEEGRFEAGEASLVTLAAAQAHKKAEEQVEKSLDDLRGSNEYAQAFAKAMRGQISVKAGRGIEELIPLYKALTEGAPADGGFLVPVDVDNTIQRIEKEWFDLSAFFRVENVSTASGWRVVETGTRTALPKVLEMGTIGKVEQPSFRKVEYSVSKYAIRMTIQDSYIGKYANSYDNKCLLMAAIKSYLESLEREGIIQAGSSSVGIDMEVQEAWLQTQGVDTSTLTEQQIKEYPTGSKVFLSAACKLLDAIEDVDLKFAV